MPLILRDPRDPPVRKDGRCVVCERERKQGQKREPNYSTAQADPFCSSECARAWYGVTLATDVRANEAREAREARAAQLDAESLDDRIRRLARAGVPHNTIKAQCHVGWARVCSALSLDNAAA